MTDQDINQMESLVKTMTDSVHGYREAAELVREEDPALSTLFMKRSDNREVMLRNMKQQLRMVDPDNKNLDTDGSGLGDLHQSFMKFRSLFQDDRDAALAEIERGESYMIGRFESALEKELSARTRETVLDTLATLKNDENSIETLRKAA